MPALQGRPTASASPRADRCSWSTLWGLGSITIWEEVQIQEEGGAALVLAEKLPGDPHPAETRRCVGRAPGTARARGLELGAAEDGGLRQPDGSVRRDHTPCVIDLRCQVHTIPGDGEGLQGQCRRSPVRVLDDESVVPLDSLAPWEVSPAQPEGIQREGSALGPQGCARGEQERRHESQTDRGQEPAAHSIGRSAPVTRARWFMASPLAVSPVPPPPSAGPSPPGIGAQTLPQAHRRLLPGRPARVECSRQTPRW
jgi:hypothetical protein